ncbi:FAD-dependent oxidoreductase, partial [Rhodococcus sp. P14]|uniref:FAD-dependent oxidoreductase n=1 Tax=Rhodococcus sp. P14 TaxID=450821 RepID=UPI00029A823E
MSQVERRADIVIVGGGVIGSAAAWRLAARGKAVILLEQFEPGHRRGASHGSSRIYRQAYDGEFYTALAGRALPLWRD